MHFPFNLSILLWETDRIDTADLIEREHTGVFFYDTVTKIPFLQIFPKIISMGHENYLIYHARI